MMSRFAAGYYRWRDYSFAGSGLARITKQAIRTSGLALRHPEFVSRLVSRGRNFHGPLVQACELWKIDRHRHRPGRPVSKGELLTDIPCSLQGIDLVDRPLMQTAPTTGERLFARYNIFTNMAPLVLVVHPSVAATFRQGVDRSGQGKPGALNYASFSIGPHLASRWLIIPKIPWQGQL